MQDSFQDGCEYARDNSPVLAALHNTDWALLAQQKLALIEHLQTTHYSADPNPLDGLLHFIDAIQDAAEKDGFPVVFLTDKED